MKSISKKMSKILPLLAVLLIVAAATTIYFAKNSNDALTIPFSSMADKIESLNNSPVSLNESYDGTLTLTTNEGVFVSHVPPNSQVVDKLVETNNVSYSYSSSSKNATWVMGGIVILLIAAGVMIQRKAKGGIGLNKMKNGLSKAKPLPNITLDDVGGLQDEMKEEIMQTLSILKEPERAAKLGIKPPKGVLLYGPPGTGKTLLAQAIARELNASFYSTSGSAFNEMFIGVGASRVRDLFQNARKSEGPAVVFIDEVDALAGKRKPHGGEEGEKTLTELLVQLDGGHPNDGILFIAATNRKDMLDDAFLRPGRLDFSFNIPLPDKSGRREIIEIHTKGKMLEHTVLSSLDDLAESTSGFSGAELNSLFETASRRAVRNGQETITRADLDYALDRTILGSTSRALQDYDTKRRVAIHEAGHALVSAVTKPGSVRKATIIPRGQALGYVAPIPKEMHLSTASELLDQIAMILAGGVAERFILGEHSIGVSGDVQQAKHMIERMVDTGLLQDGFTLTFSKQDRDVKMQQLFGEALEKAELIIKSNHLQFDQLVQSLLDKETLEGTEIEEIVTNKVFAEVEELALA
ncbi:AAA family ATPase [Mesobacillus harenae]|uniref:AAA family ATPase n=1 Tax=Mesobacillus harenae TaxID=2213203 RepID=UPI0015807006|nr:AAA family ATPase [Mesobacillus harenae]